MATSGAVFEGELDRRGQGRGVTTRAAVPGDAEGLGRMFSRCSAETILYRFHLPFPRVPPAMLGRLVNVDPCLGGAIIAEADGEIVGHGMYVREDGEDLEAEVAVVVEDGRSSDGVGRRLLAEISQEAERTGIKTLLCTTLGDNLRIQEIARRTFPGAHIVFSGGVCEMRLPLERRQADFDGRPAA